MKRFKEFVEEGFLDKYGKDAADHATGEELKREPLFTLRDRRDPENLKLSKDTFLVGEKGGRGFYNLSRNYHVSSGDEEYEPLRVHARQLKPGLKIGTEEDVHRAAEELGHEPVDPGKAGHYVHPPAYLLNRSSHDYELGNERKDSSGAGHWGKAEELTDHLRSKGFHGIMHYHPEPREGTVTPKTPLVKAVTLFDPHENSVPHNYFGSYKSSDKDDSQKLKRDLDDYYREDER